MTATASKMDAQKLERIADILKCIAHPVRLRVMELLQQQEPRTVSEIRTALGIEQSLLSHHLTKMKDKGILQAVRQGKHIHYQLTDRQLTKLFDCMEKCDFIQ